MPDERSFNLEQDPPGRRYNLPESAPDIAADSEADEAVLHAVGEGLPLMPVTPATEPAMPGDDLGDIKLHPKNSALMLERKHLLAIRWMHWINFPVLFMMIWSGLYIYWNDSIPPGQHAHQVYRLGLGHTTLFRFFPDWFYRWLNVPYHVTLGLGYHFFFMWIFAINGIFYALYLLWSREWKFMAPTRNSIREAIQVTLVDLHLRKVLPHQTKYNGAQRIAYSSIILMGFGSLLTGLAIYKPTQLHWLTSILGGYEMARWLHFLLTIGFCLFFFLHVGQVALAGWNNFRSMVSGYEIRRVDEPSLEAERSKF